jgi:hypothetical protein
MPRFIVFALFLGLVAAGTARGQTCATYPNTLTNGTTADANQVMANFNCAALVGGAVFTGSVGIGTATPQALVDMGSAITTIKLAVFELGNNYFYGLGVNTGELTFGAALTSPTGTPQMVLTQSGYLGVGTTSPSYLLHVAGTAYAVGAAGALSDIRHKDNVKTLDAGAVALVERLRPVTFTWKQPLDAGMQGQQIGFIGQEVQKVLPSVVLTEGNAERTLGIKYTELIPVLTKAIQEQQAEIETLKAQVAALQARP